MSNGATTQAEQNAQADPNKAPAYALWVQLTTRIATRELPFRAGTEEGVVDSVLTIAKGLRALIAKHPDAEAFRNLAKPYFDDVLTKNLERWHRFRDRRGQIKNAQMRERIRVDLLILQEDSRALLQALADMGGVGSSNGSQAADAALCWRVGDAFNGQRLPLLHDNGDSENAVSDGENLNQKTNVTALALSGGGVRSATFALGVLQGLRKNGLSLDFDYLSTVSGGGYLGAFLMAQNQPFDKLFPDPGMADAETPLVRHFRNRSKYLTQVDEPWFEIPFMLLQGLLKNSLHLVLLAFAVTVALLLIDAGVASLLNTWPVEQAWGPHWKTLRETTSVYWPSFIAIAIAIMFAAWFVGDSFWNKQSADEQRQEKALLSKLAFAAALALAVQLALIAIRNPPRGDWWLYWIAGLALVGLASALLPFLREYAGNFALRILLYALGPLFFLTAMAASRHAVEFFGGHSYWIAIFAAGLLMLVDVNRGGLRAYYEASLRKCFGERVDSNSGSVASASEKPIHLINSTVNLPSSDRLQLRWRKSDFFCVSNFHMGSPSTGYQTIEQVNGLDPDFDTFAAIATSGAAASTQMGWKTASEFNVLMVILNVRLGYWLRWRKSWNRRPGVFHLLSEAFGRGSEKDKFINLSDGGHIENLAVYELIRRRSRFIICVDGGCEPDLRCTDLIRLQRLVKIDFGVDLDFHLFDLVPDSKGLTNTYGTVVRIRYPNECGNDKPMYGWMLYLRLTVTGSEPESVIEYRDRHPSFPNESTADQLFEEEQFEAYRQLGECAADSFFNLALKTHGSKTIATLFEMLAENLFTPPISQRWADAAERCVPNTP